MHDRAGQRPVGAGTQQQRQVRLLHGGGAIDVHHRDLGAAFLAGADGVGHHIDLGRHRIGAPDDHQVRAADLARIGAREPAGAGHVAAPGRVHADAGEEAGIALGVGEAVDAVAHHQAHGARIEIGPHRLGAELALGPEQALRDAIQRLVPGDGGELGGALGAGAAQRCQQAVGMMGALGIAGHLRADHARRVAVVGGAAHAADAAIFQHLHLEGAGGGAVMGADRGADGAAGDRAGGHVGRHARSNSFAPL